MTNFINNINLILNLKKLTNINNENEKMEKIIKIWLDRALARYKPLKEYSNFFLTKRVIRNLTISLNKDNY
ncbi:hypothetical protein BpHYR1_053116 [Brachionus plicatilis]|uniref:Uncharacterized protein n=1 Tax=Brachionus plicatilis TaxID=10195 RepID=A0A3M7RC52_BRAPC|nr:hypothetical protein BpHYR1_053116 [Brachionus plicatilis]